MTREPVNGNRHFDGRLRSLGDGRIALEPHRESKGKKRKEAEQNAQAIEIELSNIERARLVPEI
jgi:ribosome maturation factor RimP